jgi:dTDP-4-dehydrorhamnose reductase
MRIAVFGAGGQLGRALTRVGDASVTAFDRAAADITNKAAVDAALRQARADIAINAGAYTAVDKAESDEAIAHAINAHGARHVAAAAQALGIPVIHISTDYVFDGTKHGAYVEDDPIAPLGAYGRSKAQGEAMVRAACERAVILRTAWVYGLEGANFVKTMLRLGAERDVLRVVNDQRGNPTFADDLADGILKIAGRLTDQWGTYHLTGSGQATWFEFASAIFAKRPGPRLEPIATREYPTPARRPANSVLDSTKAKRTFAVELPPWNDGLSRMLDALRP